MVSVIMRMRHKQSNIQLYFIRHGETVLNIKQDLIAGLVSQDVLTRKGKQQAKKCGMRLRKENKKFHAVFASPSKRTKETAELICKELGISKNKIQYHYALLELDQGLWQGRTRNSIYTKDNLHYITLKNPFFYPPHGESQKSVGIRMMQWLQETVLQCASFAALSQCNILIVSHGIALKCLFHEILGFDSSYIYKMVLDNCSITEFQYNNKGWIPIRINDCVHI